MLTPPPVIDERHFEEWKKSGVRDDIICLNVCSLHAPEQVDKVLNRNAKRRWKHSGNLVPCWMVSGVDPMTGESTLQGVQVKPDVPPKNKDGKIQKYLGASEYDTAPLFLRTDIDGAWKQVIDDVLVPVVITEGAKKAGAGLSIGIPTISIPGVATCRKKGRLHQNLDLFARLGRTIYLGFDNDVLRKVPVQKALVGLARELASKGSKVMIIVLPDGPCKGIDDYIYTHRAEAFKRLMDSALTFEEWREEVLLNEPDPEEGQVKSRLARQFKTIQAAWGEHLRYNSLKKKVELYGNELLADRVRLSAALTFDIDISASDALTIVKLLAEENTYSPVVEYLDEMGSKYPDPDISFLDGLSREYFGSEDPTHAIYFKKFLVSAVARARQPGCKVDTVFMLVSPKQGKYKSTFFRVLFGDDWFSDQLGGDVGDKDEKMKMHRFWCLEWSEFEAVYKKKDISSLKNFITSIEDTFRAPYDRDMTTYQRPCVFVGTSNEQEILHDPTGDRRFWIVPVTLPKIPILQVAKDKDRIWATANALYEAGFEWRLTDEEELKREELNKDYRSSDYWEEIIEELSSDSIGWISTESIVRKLGFDDPRHLDTQSQRRLTNVMTKLGFARKTSKVNGISKRGWIKISEASDQNLVSNVTGVTPLANQGLQAVTLDENPVYPNVTGVTEEDIASDSGYTSYIRKNLVQQPEPLPHKAVTPVTLEKPFLAKTSEDNILETTTPDVTSAPVVRENENDLDIPEFIPNSNPVKFKVGGMYYWQGNRGKCTIISIESASDGALIELEGGKQSSATLSELLACKESPRWREGEQVGVVGMNGKTFTISTIRNDELWLKDNNKKGRLGPLLSRSYQLRELK